MKVVLVLWLLLVLPCWVTCKKKPPHIMFILADDWGWHDCGWAPLDDIPTPRLDELRKESLELTQFYAQPKCTATRAALMTGRYPYKMGVQSEDVFSRAKNNTLDPKYKLLPAYLKDLGYHTHMVGKWHLGNCNANATPIHKGFDTHFGSWANTDNHFSLISKFYDWNWQNEPYWQAQGTFTAHLITNHTQFMLKKHFGNETTKNDPIFLYVAHLVPHKPAMAPEKYINETKCSLIPEKIRWNETTEVPNLRRPYCGMVAAMDEGIGNITDTLRQLGVLDDFIIIVTSDNGGAMGAGASNYPLRGNKQTVYEGGTRARTLLRAPKFLKENHTTGEYTGLVHVTDILPTLVRAAGASPRKILPMGDLDGKNAWPYIKKGLQTKRHWMVYNIDSNRKLGAIRFKNASADFKLIFSNHSKTETGYRSPDPRPENERQNDTRQQRYKRTQAYFLYDLSINEEEIPPSQFPDAAKDNKEIFTKMKRKLRRFTKNEVDVIKYYPLAKHARQGAYRVAGC